MHGRGFGHLKLHCSSKAAAKCAVAILTKKISAHTLGPRSGNQSPRPQDKSYEPT